MNISQKLCPKLVLVNLFFLPRGSNKNTNKKTEKPPWQLLYMWQFSTPKPTRHALL